MQSQDKLLLGDLLLREGLLTQKHVTHAYEVQRTLASPLPYGEVCLRLGFLFDDPPRAHGAEWRAPEHRSREAQRAACRSAAGRRSRRPLEAASAESEGP